MEHSHHGQKNLRKVAFSATLHCLTGCAIGEVLGMVTGTALGWSNFQTILLAVVLAFFFGYLLTLIPLFRSGIEFRKALPLALAADTVSITIMEIVDNGVIILIPGALHAPITSLLFWGSLALALVIAFIVAYPVNLYLISRGKGHAIIPHHH